MNKINYLGLAAIAAFGLASCSSDEPGNGSNNGAAKGEQYMAVTIRTAGMNGTRAAELGDPEFEDPAAGSNEGTVTKDNIYFYFFDGDGNPFQLAAANVNGAVATNVVKPVEISSANTNGAEPGTIQGVLVLGKAANEGYVGTTPSQMLCVANPVSTNIDAYANKPLKEVLDIASSNASLPTLTNFVMTSSTYVDGGEKVVATDVTGKFATTPEAAKANPATIYLERLAVKVRAHGLGDFTPEYRNADGDIVENYQYKVNNEEVDLQVTLDGWRLVNISTQSLAFKNIVADGNYFTGWNNADLHRCYWALSKVSNPLINKIVNCDIYDANQWKRGNFNADQPTTNIAYAYENTQYATDVYTSSVSDRMSNATGILVKATVKMKKAGETEFTPVDLVRWAGAYYTEDELKNMIIANYNVTTGSSLTASDVSFVKDTEPNRWKAQVTNGTVVTDWSTNYNNIMRWIDGATSYYLNIEHLGNLYGVVRNHIYDYEFTGVVGLGVPGNDPENPEPEDETFLAAKVAILNWHVISNKFVLE